MISINTARKWDRLLGIPICYAISLLRLFRRKRKFDRTKISNITVIKMWGVGSLVLAGKTLHALKTNFPDAKINLVTLETNRGLYDFNPEIHTIYYFSIQTPLKLVFNTFKLLKWLWKTKPDLVVDLETASRFTAIISFLSFRRITVGFSPAGSGKNIFDVNVPYHESVHVSELFLRCVDALGLSFIKNTSLTIPVENASRVKVDNWIEANGIGKFILINPNTSKLAIERLWPEHYFSELITSISDFDHTLSIVLTGSADEKTRNEKIIEHTGKINGMVFNSAGIFSINEFISLIQKAELMITNDSGPAQLGFISNTPTIALYGPETPLLYGAMDSDIHTNLSSFEPCSPCISIFNDKVVYCTKNAVCMKNLTVETVFESFLKSISKKKKTGE